MTLGETFALWAAGLAAVGIGGLVVYEKFYKVPSIAAAAPGATVPTTTDASGATVVQLVAGQALGTLAVPVGTSITVQAPAGQPAATSYTSSNQAVLPSGALSAPLTGGGVALGAALAAGTTTLMFYGGTSWGCSFVIVAS